LPAPFPYTTLFRSAQVNWCTCFGRGESGSLGFQSIAGRDDYHPRDNASDGDVFNSLVSATVWAHRDTSMRTDDDDWAVVVADGGADLFPVPARAEHSVGRDERNFPHGREARGDRGQVLLSHTDLDEALWELVSKEVHLGRLGQVCAETDYSRVLFSSLKQTLAEAFPVGYLLDICIEHLCI